MLVCCWCADQPSGSGYSYSDAGDVGPFDEAGVADNVYQFLQGFLMQYPQFQTVPFYITGESYASVKHARKASGSQGTDPASG